MPPTATQGIAHRRHCAQHHRHHSHLCVEGNWKGPCGSLCCGLSFPTPPPWFPVLWFHVLWVFPPPFAKARGLGRSEGQNPKPLTKHSTRIPSYLLKVQLQTEIPNPQAQYSLISARSTLVFSPWDLGVVGLRPAHSIAQLPYKVLLGFLRGICRVSLRIQRLHHTATQVWNRFTAKILVRFRV